MDKLTKNILFTLLICAFSFCGNEGTTSATKQESSEDSSAIHQGKVWLIKNIEAFFNNDANFMKGFSSLCTPEYSEFKTDATNVDLDGGMTEAAFKTKWGRRYSEYAGIGDGFMIAGSDYGTITVTSCEFKHLTEMQSMLYDVVITDTTYHSKFTRQVALVKHNNSFLIDDVREISNEFQK